MKPRQRRLQPPPRKKACNNCTKAKVRCDLEKPTCSRCRASGRTCEYLHPTHAESPPLRASREQCHAASSEGGASERNIHLLSTPGVDVGIKMPGLPLSYGSPSVGWSPRPLQISGSRGRVQEQNPELNLRAIQLVPGSNAEDIRDRWLRPYILPPVGWTEVPKVYHPFTLQYISLVLGAYPRRMLKDGDVPPIVHHAQVHSAHIPRSLANCYTLVRMYEQAVPGSEAMAVAMVEKEMERLADEDPSQDDCDLLAVFQAYLIYSIMLYFSPIHGTSSVNDKTMITLMDLAFRTAKNGLFCKAEATNTRPTWESWIVAATKRRAIFTMYIFSSVYNADRNLPNFIADELRELYVPGRKVLWEARDRETWEKEYDRQLIEWDDGMLQISELWKSDETGSPERRRRIKRWVGTVDEFGMMIFAVCSHTHGC